MKTLSIAAAAILLAGTAQGAVLNFENAATPGVDEATLVGQTINTQYESTFGVSFSSPDTARNGNGVPILGAAPGAPIDGVGGTDGGGGPNGAFIEGFVNNTLAIDDFSAAIGEYFLGGIIDQGPIELTITYDTTFAGFENGVNGFNFDLIDIDTRPGGTTLPEDSTALEQFEVTATDTGGNTFEQTFTAGDPGTGDAVATNVSFAASNIVEIHIIGRLIDADIWLTSGVANEIDGAIGIAFDNFDVDDPASTVIPVPASLPLLLAGLGGLAWIRRRAA